jgi:hypothetical protein
LTSEDLARARAAWLRRELPQRLWDWRRYVDDLNDHLPSETVAAMLSADHAMWENARAIAAYLTARVQEAGRPKPVPDEGDAA